jgi:hypothetical protein
VLCWLLSELVQSAYAAHFGFCFVFTSITLGFVLGS